MCVLDLNWGLSKVTMSSISVDFSLSDHTYLCPQNPMVEVLNGIQYVPE